MRVVRTLLPALALFGLAPVSGGAVTYTTTTGVSDPGKLATEMTFFTFDAPPSPGFAYSGSYNIVTGTLAGHYIEPAGDKTAYFYVSPELSDGVATLNALDLSTVSFYWGSVDNDNAVEVLGVGGTTLTTIHGSDLLPADGANAKTVNLRIFISAGRDKSITGLRFHATDNPFEIDDVAGTFVDYVHVGPVPEPAAWALLLVGFGVIGVGMRCRRAFANGTRPGAAECRFMGVPSDASP